MNWVVLIISTVLFFIGLFIGPRTRNMKKKVTCTKIIDSSSKPLLKPCEEGEVCEYGEESGHDIHECEEFGYVYTINGVNYTREGKVIQDTMLKDSPTTMTREIEVEQKDYTIKIVLGVFGGFGIIISPFI
jgi:hypothetical protein